MNACIKKSDHAIIVILLLTLAIHGVIGLMLAPAAMS